MVMDRVVPQDADQVVDLERGLNVGEENSCKAASSSGVIEQTKSLFAKVCSVFAVDEARNEEEKANAPSCTGLSSEHVKLNGQKTGDHAEKKVVVKEKRKKTSNKKAPKPPRPPRGPSLDAADQKLIQEISELVMLKRARVERMKALKKMKAAKASSNSNLFAMVFTIIFCIIILFQGVSSRATSANLQGSPMSAQTVDGSLISVQFLGNPSASGPNESTFRFPNPVEPIAGSDPPENLRRAAG
ncbi:hypothetical protein Tsubulata_029657 [Turnera subulata]|uniref:Transmembrane protein n=1 Tax=Turnera subulata TaxID=218843 RepID=A0A9Q0FTE6_9ROSI|nr:hypothetical protein Tsubulata_029657 [Turnera subulata]